MDLKQAAAEFDGRQYGDECNSDLHRRLKTAGIVAVFGGSDDLIYFAGAANDELGARNGKPFYFTNKGLLLNECGHKDCPYYEREEASAAVVTAVWNDGGFSWRYKTELPHETFIIYEGSETYCEGIVFALKDITHPN